MNLFESTTVSWWSGEIAVTCNGTALAKARFGNWKTTGVITMDENDYEVVGDSIFGGVLSLRLRGALLIQTRIRGFWNQSADLAFDGIAYRLKWSGWDSRAVLEKEGHEIGSVEPGELFSGGPRAAFPEDLPPLVSVFVIWLVAYKRRLNSSAAAG
jgi:hypothetical protein